MAHEPSDEWQPATSRPGEIHTVEGQIAGVGAFARGLKRRAARRRRGRGGVLRPALWIAGLGALIVALVVALS